MTDWDTLKKGGALFKDALTKYTGLSAQARDNIWQFMRDSRAHAAFQKVLKVEGRLEDMGKDGEELERMGEEWSEEEAPPSAPKDSQ